MYSFIHYFYFADLIILDENLVAAISCDNVRTNFSHIIIIIIYEGSNDILCSVLFKALIQIRFIINSEIKVQAHYYEMKECL